MKLQEELAETMPLEVEVVVEMRRLGVEVGKAGMRRLEVLVEQVEMKHLVAVVVELVAVRPLEVRVQTWKALQEESQLPTKIHRHKRA